LGIARSQGREIDRRWVIKPIALLVALDYIEVVIAECYDAMVARSRALSTREVETLSPEVKARLRLQPLNPLVRLEFVTLSRFPSKEMSGPAKLKEE
jgi:hypothetical protein